MKSKINLTEEAKSSFRKMYKAGIYKELYKRQLLTDAQLNLLLNKKWVMISCASQDDMV